MIFHQVVLNYDGNIALQRQIEPSERLANEDRAKAIRQFSDLLRKNRQGSPVAMGDFSAKIGDRECSWEVVWRQPEPTSAIVSFIARKSAIQTILLTGFVPEMDAIVVKTVRNRVADLFEGVVDADPGPSLAAITVRPVVIDIPCGTDFTEAELRQGIGLSTCLAQAFFVLAEVEFEALKAAWMQYRSRLQARSPKRRRN